METITKRAEGAELSGDDTDRLFRLALAVETAEAWRVERDGLAAWKLANSHRRQSEIADMEAQANFMRHWSPLGYRDEAIDEIDLGTKIAAALAAIIGIGTAIAVIVGL